MYLLRLANAAHHSRGVRLHDRHGEEAKDAPRWQRACKFILANAEMVDVSRALEFALSIHAKLDVSRVPGK